MPRYAVETDKGTFEIELDREVEDTPAGWALLARLVAEQLRNQAAAQNSLGSLATQVVGGVRDVGQQFLDLPAAIVNTIGEFISLDPPGGPRRRLVPAVQAPQFPDTAPPQTGLERGVRTGTTLAADLATAVLGTAPGRHMVQRGMHWLAPPRRPMPMLFERGAVVGRSAPAGQTRVPTLAQPTELLKTPPSEGARNLARLVFEFHADDIPHMSLKQATAARQRILRLVPDYDLARESGPLQELLTRLEEHILRHR